MALTKARRRVFGSVPFVAAVVLVAALILWEPDEVAEPPSPPEIETGPVTLVAMGDSTMSGEGAGDYIRETDGLNGNWCHRSPHAAVHRIQLPQVETTVNLACSGATSAHVGWGDVKQWTEPSQSRQLAELVKTHRIRAVLVAVGANDDPRLSSLMPACLGAWLSGDPPCSSQVARDWPRRLDAMVPKVVTALGDIQTVLRQSGYARADYDLVLLSYASPLSPEIPGSLRDLSGCPLHTEDLRWLREDAVPSMSASLHQAAVTAGARFLDMSRAGHGHEACTGGEDPGSEWFTRFTVHWDYLEDAERASHATVDSFHPNARGHEATAHCLTDFLVSADLTAACEPGDGTLQAHLRTSPSDRLSN